MKQGWVTLLSSIDYLNAVLVLIESFRRVGSKYPIIVGVTDTVFQHHNVIHSLQYAGAKVAHIESLTYHPSVLKKYSNCPVLNTASKLNLFTLTDWDKLIYIDADSIVLQNMDELFDYPDGAMLMMDPDDIRGFTGLFVFVPRNHPLELYLLIMQHKDCFDGDLLGELWKPFTAQKQFQIPSPYFYAIYFYTEKDQSQDSSIKAVHFVNQPKPWENTYQWSNDHEWLKVKYNTLLNYVQKFYCAE